MNKTKMEDFQATVEAQVRFRDTDALGHVNNAVYLSWMELGRMAFTDAILPEIDWTKTGFILAHVSIDYLEPVFLGDKVKVYMRAGKIGGKSVVLECLITKTDKKGERPTAKGTNIIVAFDYKTNRSVPIPEDWKTAMAG
ncbi:MAG: acyl-CoA thioesterase [Flavobacteriales bacterium]|nr:acyl-CoA thioesterase [Flavobacteriales bacterium]